MPKTTLSLLAAALALTLSLPVFADEPMQTEPETTAQDTVVEPTANDPDPQETGDPVPNEPSTATATALPSSGPRLQPAFADLDTDADGYVSESDIPAELELSLQFAVADTDQDDRLSQAEFDAYQTMPEDEEEEAEE
jgi:hypothetical protein